MDSPIEATKPRRLFGNLIREPLIQFVTIGALIFVVAEWLASTRESDANTIHINDGLHSYLSNLYSAQFGYTPSPEILEGLIQNYVREEVLFRDALQIGLAKQDEIIRRRLIQKMEYLILDSEIQAEAPEGALQMWYNNHLEDFQLPAKTSFRHVYFSGNDEDTKLRAKTVLVIAQQHGTSITPAEGDHFPLNASYSDLSKNEVAQLFGRTDFTDNLFLSPIGKWSGPWQSGYGWHLLFVEKRTDGIVRPYVEVADQIFSAWQEHDQKQRFEKVLAERISTYMILREETAVEQSQ